MDITPSAFTRIETPRDFHDAVLLLLSGTDIAFEPVVGSMFGFACPMAWVPVNHNERFLRIKLRDTPESLADAFLTLIQDRRKAYQSLTVTILGDTERKDAILRALQAVVVHMSFRAHMMLTATDIVAIMGHVASLSDAACDAQLAYGHPEWGAFVRGESSEPDLQTPPDPRGVSRTLVCHVKPSEADLERIIDHAPVRLVNAKAGLGRSPWFRGVSVCGRFPMGNHFLMPLVTAETADHDELAACAYSGHVAVSQPVHGALQEAWTDQRTFLHPFGVVSDAIEGVFPREEHEAVLKAGLSAGVKARVPRTINVTPLPTEKAPASAAEAKKLLKEWDALVTIQVG